MHTRNTLTFPLRCVTVGTVGLWYATGRGCARVELIGESLAITVLRSATGSLRCCSALAQARTQKQRYTRTRAGGDAHTSVRSWSVLAMYSRFSATAQLICQSAAHRQLHAASDPVSGSKQ